jgi:diaminopimelate decarboxylase
MRLIRKQTQTKKPKPKQPPPGFGIECASIGEVQHALLHCKVPKEHIVFDSPCKTTKELEFGIVENLYTNFDNLDEYARAKKIVAEQKAKNPKFKTGPLGMRINPLVGAGTIAALSVSTAESKFGTPVSFKDEMMTAYLESPWMNSVHVRRTGIIIVDTVCY